MLPKLKKEYFIICLLPIVLLWACNDNQAVAPSVAPPIDSILSIFLPIDASNVDALQILTNYKAQAWHEVANGFDDKTWADFEWFHLIASTAFKTLPLNAQNVKCAGITLTGSSGPLFSDFNYGWPKNTGPAPYTDLHWEFTRDGQTVYDTIPVANDVGHITFSSNYASPTNGVTMFWENASDGGEIVLAIRVMYRHPTDISRSPLRSVSKNAIHIPNTGSFALSKAVLESQFGAEFDNPNRIPWYLEVYMVKGNYKFKNYGANNDKTLLTASVVMDCTMIMFEE